MSGWSESYTKQVRSALEKDVYPVLGKRSIVDITARDVLALLQKKERTAPEQARKLRQRIGEIFKFAVITELVTRNPVADLDTALKARDRGTMHGCKLTKFRPSTKHLREPGACRFRRNTFAYIKRPKDRRTAFNALGMGRSGVSNNHPTR